MVLFRKIYVFHEFAKLAQRYSQAKTVFYSIQYKNGQLTASDLFDMFMQSTKFYYTFCYHVLRVKTFEKYDSLNGSKNEWLLLPASFTAKFKLLFVLTLENAFSQRFYFKANKTAQVLLKNGTGDFQNSPPFARLACFYVTISGNFKRISIV